MFRISAVRFISRQLTGARIRPGVIALLICVYLNESKPCRITAHNCSVPLLDHSLTTSFLPLSPSVSIVCFHSLPCLFILHLMPTALFLSFFCHIVLFSIPLSLQIIANHHMQSISFASGGDPVSHVLSLKYLFLLLSLFTRDVDHRCLFRRLSLSVGHLTNCNTNPFIN